MPAYPFLLNRELQIDDIKNKMLALQFAGMPYTEEYQNNFKNDLNVQLGISQDSTAIEGFKKRYGDKIAIRKFNKKSNKITEMDALV